MGDTNAPLMILILGAVGVGKSTFIGAAGTIKAAPKIHLEPEPPRAAVEEFELKSNHERTVSLVDTPGFNYPGSHDSTVLDDIIEFLKAKLRKSPDQKVGGIIYLLDASSKTRAQYSADNMQPPPLLVLATAHPEHDSDKPISEAVKSSLTKKYGAEVYQGDHFGSIHDSDPREAAWKIIRRVLDMNPDGVSVQSVIESLKKIRQNYSQAQKGTPRNRTQVPQGFVVEGQIKEKSFFRSIFCCG